ncbi:hypothetical protein F3Y22_tig00116943pilonHSYRG00045 [Hibiscus syriacus]|uniref:Uncharacterized protein n=1 Tax=Hibiscus syriacus TaxID=106335 RepID=A0A6A2XRJ0_HIBSY|nr:hypothetical protein F3Y22_tig00116943pilonHSYRG00045 [Hibiscus syriacus]
MKAQSKNNITRKMMQSENLTPSWPFDGLVDSSINYFDFSDISSNSDFIRMFSDEIFRQPAYDFDDQLHVIVPRDEFSVPLVELDSMLTDEVGEDSFPLSQSQPCSSQRQDVWSPCLSSEASISMTTEQSSLAMPKVVRSAKPWNGPCSIYRLTMFETKEIIYCKSLPGTFEVAFKTFHQIFPYGRFAHFAANSVEAMPIDVDLLHIVDFDIGSGIQWPLLIEAMAMQHKTQTDITKMGRGRLRSFGLNLKLEEMGMKDLANKLEGMKKRGRSREWLAFNCMVGLPHMGENKNRKLVNEFLDLAKQLLARNKGIITLVQDLGPFFNGQLSHYQAITESMESDIAKHLVQARMAMECLFVGPNISAQAWFQKWEQMNETRHFEAATTMEGVKLSRESNGG